MPIHDIYLYGAAAAFGLYGLVAAFGMFMITLMGVSALVNLKK